MNKAERNAECICTSAIWYANLFGSFLIHEKIFVQIVSYDAWGGGGVITAAVDDVVEHIYKHSLIVNHGH